MSVLKLIRNIRKCKAKRWEGVDSIPIHIKCDLLTPGWHHNEVNNFQMYSEIKINGKDKKF